MTCNSTHFILGFIIGIGLLILSLLVLGISSAIKKNRKLKSTLSSTHGQGPFRSAEFVEEPVSSKLWVWLVGGSAMIKRWFNQRDLQIALRFSILPVAACLIYYLVRLMLGDTVSNAAVYLPNGHLGFQISRWTDIPGIFLASVGFIWLSLIFVRNCKLFYERVTENDDPGVAFFFVGSVAAVVGSLILGGVYCSSTDTPTMTWFWRFFWASLVGGAIVGIWLSFVDWYKIGWRLSICGHALLLLLLFLFKCFISGFAVGLIQAVSTLAMFVIPFVVTYLLVIGVLNLVYKGKDRIVSIWRWFTAVNLAEDDQHED